MMSEEMQLEIQVKYEMMVTTIMEMDVALIEQLKLGGFDQEEVRLRLTLARTSEDMDNLQRLWMNSQLAMI
jgi:hypothetical protein